MPKVTPTPVRVARWSALVAVVTAIGSFLNTMWTTAPWWVQQPKPAADTMSAVAAPAPAPAPGTYEMMVSSSYAPDPTVVELVIQHVKANPVSMSLVGLCGLVVVWSVVAEYVFRKKNRTEETP